MIGLLAELQTSTTDAELQGAGEDGPRSFIWPMPRHSAMPPRKRALEEASKATNDEGVRAKANSVMARWVASSANPASQAKILEEITPVAKENSHNADLASALNFMVNVGPANDRPPRGRRWKSFAPTSRSTVSTNSWNNWERRNK